MSGKPKPRPKGKTRASTPSVPLDTIHLSGTLAVYGASADLLQVIVSNRSAPGRAYVVGIPVEWLRERIALIDEALAEAADDDLG